MEIRTVYGDLVFVTSTCEKVQKIVRLTGKRTVLLKFKFQYGDTRSQCINKIEAAVCNLGILEPCSLG